MDGKGGQETNVPPAQFNVPDATKVAKTPVIEK